MTDIFIKFKVLRQFYAAFRLTQKTRRLLPMLNQTMFCNSNLAQFSWRLHPQTQLIAGFNQSPECIPGI